MILSYNLLSVNINSPFESGGIHGDVIRNIYGEAWLYNNDYGLVYANSTLTGVFQAGSSAATGYGSAQTNLTPNPRSLKMDASLAVPTSKENSPRTLSINYWRRVS